MARLDSDVTTGQGRGLEAGLRVGPQRVGRSLDPPQRLGVMTSSTGDAGGRGNTTREGVVPYSMAALNGEFRTTPCDSD